MSEAAEGYYVTDAERQIAALQQRVERLTGANERVRTVNQDLLERIERLTAMLAQRDVALREIDSLTSGGICVMDKRGKDRFIVLIAKVARAALADAGPGVAGEA